MKARTPDIAPVPKPISFALVAVWLVAAVTVAGFLQFDWSQDIAAYANNIERNVFFGEIIRDENKSFWYNFIVFPIWNFTGDVEKTLTVLKCTTMTMIFLSQRKNIMSNLDAILLISIIAFVPVVSDNLNEYLRQGMGIGLFLIAMSFRRPEIRWPLLILAFIQHKAVIFLVASALGGWYLARVLFGKTGRLNAHAVGAGAVALALAGLLSIAGQPVVQTLPLAAIGDFLGGDRSNILGSLYLVVYAGYVGIQAATHRSVGHCIAFVGLLTICGLYSMILDFGRAISLIAPLHLSAAFSLPSRQDRYVDLAAMIVAAGAFLLASH